MNIPIFDAVFSYTGQKPEIFHMPGHKAGKAVPEEFHVDPFLLDITELAFSDNLHNPSGVIAQAETLAARAFGAGHTYFLVNGSTSGIMAAVFTLCRPGGKLIVGRDCHRSVIAAMSLARVNPVYVMPSFLSEFGIPAGCMPVDLEVALKQNPDADAVMVTRPGYYGICSDISSIVKICRKYDKPLIVDEAHGSHLHFSTEYPVSAMSAGTDICIQSAHKTLPALTQGAYLHVHSHIHNQNNKIDLNKLRYYLQVFQTSSPSYLIMAYLDLARALMEEKGGHLLGDIARNICSFKAELEHDNPSLRVLGKNSLPSGFDYDPSRIVVNVSKTGLSGYDFERILRNDYNIYSEMVDLFNIVFIATIADSSEKFLKLKDAFDAIMKNNINILKNNENTTKFSITPFYGTLHYGILPEMSISLTEAASLASESILLENAEGRVCKYMLIPYPPGIPLVCPGEVISKQLVDILLNILIAGGEIMGIGRKHNSNPDEIKNSSCFVEVVV